MIKGPWPTNHDETEFVVPLEPPYLTPMFMGERVALRVSRTDSDARLKIRLGQASAWITDLDTNRRYELRSKLCGTGCCNCDAEITEPPMTEALRILDEMRDSFMYNLSSDYHIEFVESRDARLREILATLAAPARSAS